MAVRRPRGNAFVLAVLRSPAHRLLSSVAIELRYTGRRSGRQYVLPVQYARTDGRLVVAPQRPELSTWWRNFRTPQPVTVLVRGRLREGTARVVGPGNPSWEEDRRVYESRWRSLGGSVTGPLVEITIDGER
jgi:deazaflavin-dependent oxidoreductase (nitroreductase family)